MTSTSWRRILSTWCLAASLWTGCGGGSPSSSPPPPPPPPPETFTTTTFQTGSLLVLQNQSSTDTVRIGLETNWGGSIVEVSLNGTNYVNAHDTGREVQPAFYDGNAHYDACAGCTGVFGWNPVLGGDKYDQGTPMLAQTLTPNSLYTKAQSLQWNPDDKGGGPGAPVVGDVMVEQTITSVAGRSHAFKAHYKVTHLGSDFHANVQQEFPAVYTNGEYNQFVYYGGNTPWTNGAVTTTQFQQLGTPGLTLYVPEHWGAHVNGQSNGLTVYVPSQYPYVGGFDYPGPGGPTDATNYFAPFAMLTIAHELHQAASPPDLFAPFGSTDTPSAGSNASGVIQVAGWAFDDGSVTKVEIMVDGSVDGSANYGSARPDVAAAYPHAPTDVGYSYSLNTAKYSNGVHVLNVRVTDAAGNVAVFADVRVTVTN